MQRRKFLIGAAGTAIGGSALVGSGAFTSVEADRDIAVDVADDSDAFLAIEPADTPNGDAYATETDGTIELNFDDGADFDDISGTDGGSGINDRATTVFDDVFVVTNQGTQDVAVGIEFDTDANPAQVGVGGNILRGDATGDTHGDNNVVLGPGDSEYGGVFFNLGKDDDFESVIDDLNTITFHADVEGANLD